MELRFSLSLNVENVPLIWPVKTVKISRFKDLFFALWLNLSFSCVIFGLLGWRAVDERLIRRGELLLSLDFLESYECELMALNCGKVGRPFKLTGRYVEFLAVVRYLFSISEVVMDGAYDNSEAYKLLRGM